MLQLLLCLYLQLFSIKAYDANTFLIMSFSNDNPLSCGIRLSKHPNCDISFMWHYYFLTSLCRNIILTGDRYLTLSWLLFPSGRDIPLSHTRYIPFMTSFPGRTSLSHDTPPSLTSPSLDIPSPVIAFPWHHPPLSLPSPDISHPGLSPPIPSYPWHPTLYHSYSGDVTGVVTLSPSSNPKTWTRN